MATPTDIPQNFSTTLNVPGGINNTQTTGIILTSVTGLPTDGGILCINWASTLDTSVAEYIEYTSISSNELGGVTRGVEGISAKAHSNAATVVGVVSRQHIKRLRDKLTGNDATAIQDPNANEILKTSYVASAVNEVTLTNAATGNAPSLEATGGDTNIPIILKGKGTGAVRLGQATSTNVRLEADQPIADSSGNEYIKFSKTASAVNEVTLTNAATGNAVQITATGGDTNIDLTLAGKGTGKVREDARYGTITTDSDGATVTFNMATSNIHTVTLGGNRTLAVSNVSVGQCFIIRLVQDGTGTRTVTWFSTIKWAGGSAPTLTTTINKADTFGFLCTSSGNYDGYTIGTNV